MSKQKTPEITNRSIIMQSVYLYMVQDGKCYYCRGKLDPREPESHFDRDHKIPVSRGGKTNTENICLSCFPCNREKADLTEDEYRKALVAVADGRIGRADINPYGKFVGLREKFGPSELEESYRRGWTERTAEIVQLAESMIRPVVDLPTGFEEYDDSAMNDGANMALQELMRAIEPK